MSGPLSQTVTVSGQSTTAEGSYGVYQVVGGCSTLKKDEQDAARRWEASLLQAMLNTENAYAKWASPRAATTCPRKWWQIRRAKA